ncbi:MFS transporter [Bradyrhizobium sp. NP1]|uniref:MFS transporter n=1 Tax=Bradyrhizobium sp. NP1 TaxID=3049772 RepID=UPI0025A51416|nr:MFS transporter [Bradyrhizobium sp. NP1]WJR75841.1 MFS transporter [Bradyrhizobium sp. NP1]
MLNDERTIDANGHAKMTIVLGMLVALLEGVDFQIIGVVAPVLIKTLGFSPQQIGELFSSSLVGLAIGSLIGGKLADQIGRKPTLVGAILVMGAFTLGAAATDNFMSLLVMRFLTGVGLGGALPNMIALVSEAVHQKRRTFFVAIISCGLALGGVIISLLGRFALPELGWRGLFVVGGVLPVLIVPVLAFALKETRSRNEANAVHVGVAAALFSEQRAVSTVSLWIGFALTLFQLSLLLNWLPTLVIAKGLSAAEAFTALLFVNVGSLVGSSFVGWMCDRYGARWPMALVYTSMMATMVGLGNATHYSEILAWSFLAGVVVLGAQFVLYGLAPKIYPAESRGFGVGAAAAAGRIGAIVAPIVAGQMIGAGATASTILTLMVPLVLCAGLAIFLLSFSARSALASEA